MLLITGMDLLENPNLSNTQSIKDRFNMFSAHFKQQYFFEDMKYLFYCLETGKVLSW